MTMILTLSGPSGAGKSVLEKRLVASGAFTRIRSFTTRSLRPGEVNGVDYDFIDAECLNDWNARGEILQQVALGATQYGTTRSTVAEIFSAGQSAVIVVEPTTVPVFKRFAGESGHDFAAVYLNNSLETLMTRFLRRATQGGAIPDWSEVGKRLARLAQDEMRWIDLYPDWDYVVHDFSETTEALVIQNVLDLANLAQQEFGKNITLST